MTSSKAPALPAGDSLWTPARHPLARFLRGLGAGDRPEPDGSWMRVTPWSPHIQAVLSFSGHAVLAVSYDITDNRLAELDVDGWGKATSAHVLTALAGAHGWIGPHELLLLGQGHGGEVPDAQPLVSRSDLAHRPTAERARRTLTEVQILGDPDRSDTDLVILARGVGGIRQVEVEIDPELRGTGRTANLLTRALAGVPANELVVAPVFAGDAAAVGVHLATGFIHVGSIVHFSTRPERS